jgi:hypothetical protein
MHPAVPPGYWRRHALRREIEATREAPSGGWGVISQPDAREGQAGQP